MGQALPGRGPASGPASGARKRSGHTLERGRPMGGAPNAHEQLSAEMLASGQFASRRRSRAHCGVRRSSLVDWRLLTRLLDSPVVVWSWFCGIKISTPTLICMLRLCVAKVALRRPRSRKRPCLVAASRCHRTKSALLATFQGGRAAKEHLLPEKRDAPSPPHSGTCGNSNGALLACTYARPGAQT